MGRGDPAPDDVAGTETPPALTRARWQHRSIVLMLALLVAFGVSEALGARQAFVPSAPAPEERLASQSRGLDAGRGPDGSALGPGLGSGNGGPGGGKGNPGGLGAAGGAGDAGSNGNGSGGGSGNGSGGDPPRPSSPPPPSPPPSPPTGQRPPARPHLTLADGGTALFTIPNAAAGRKVARCVTVTYKGPRPARVRLYAKSSGTLAPYLQVVLKRGRAAPGHGCAGFRRDAADYVGRGRGILFRGRLADFPSTFEAASGSAATPAWKHRESHVYRFKVRIVSANAAQGRSATFNLIWQARA
jgi:hypothetical protein